MKIIIVGCGKVGLTLAERLNQENHDITLIDSDYTTVRTAADSLDVMAVTGNGAIYQVQMEAGIKEADMTTIALPDYGFYTPTEDTLCLMGDVRGKNVLEIACGRGVIL